MFEPLTWAIGLSAVAAGVLLTEAIAVLAPIRRSGRWAFWIALPASAGAGILLAWVWGSWAGKVSPLVKPLFGPLPIASRAAILMAMGALTTACLLLAVAVVHRLASALAGASSIAGFLGALVRGIGLTALAGATVFWVPRGAVLAIGMSTIMWAVRSYRRTTSPVRQRVRALLLGLRILAVLLLTTWAIRPALEYRHKEDIKTVLLVCADTSSSMQRADAGETARSDQPGTGPEPVSRILAVREALNSRRRDLAHLADKADLELISFSASAEAPESFASDLGWSLFSLRSADGPATALGDALAEAFELHVGQQRKVSAIILISDGCNNTADVMEPGKLAALMGSRNVPIHTVGVGSERATGTTKTLNVRDLAAPDEVEAFNRLPVTAVIETIGLESRRVKVTCRFGDEEVGSEMLVVDRLRSSQPVRFVHVPLSAGFHRVRVAAEIVGEAPKDIAGQGDAGKLVHVVDREMRVLYVEGKFRYEAKYIARALMAARRFTVDRRVLLQPLMASRPTPLSENLDDWLAYHAIIFGDVGAAHFTRRQLEIIREVVGKYGKGFCMIGGANSFGGGGWADTPIADVLPIDLETSKLQIDSPIKVVPTREGRESDMMRLEETGANVAADWDKLDLLPGANRLGGLKPAATVLAETPQGIPLIVTQPYGKGRAAAIALDTTWRWVLTKKDTADLQRRFWRQVALFLAAPKGTVWVVTDKTNYDLRRLRHGTEVIRISAGVEDSRGRPLLDAPAQVRLAGPDGKETSISLQKDGKIRRGQLLPPTKPGVYTLKIDTRVGGKALAAEHRFEVLHRDLESLEVLANHDLLRRMSSLSGGKFVTLDRFGNLLKDLRVTTKTEKRDTVTHVKLSQSLRWPIIVAIILLMCAEWAFRKRKGLV
ncbi:MAG: glutamine amidotransferase [Phycisphaerae bacterium]